MDDAVRLCPGVSVREPEDKNLDLQVERLVRAGCSMGNIRAEEASGAKDDRGGLLETAGPGGRRGTPWWSPTSTGSPGG